MGSPQIEDIYVTNLAKHGNKPALISNNQTITYKDLQEKSMKLAETILAKKLHSNEKVAILLPNSIEFVMIDLAIIFSGSTRVALNTMLSEKEIYYILEDSEATIIFIDQSFLGVLKRIEGKLQNLRHIVVLNNDDGEVIQGKFIEWDQFYQKGTGNIEFKNPVYSEEDEALIAYTGGTTGFPKGAVYSNRKLLLVLLAHIIELEVRKDDKMLLTSPFAHSAGMILLAGLLKGATIYIENKFNPKTVLELFEQERITFAFMVPTMIYRLIDQIGNEKKRFKSLRTILYGAAPMSVQRLKNAIDIFGPVFTQLYGQTESYNFITRLTKEDHLDGLHNENKLTSCGQSALMSNVKIINKEGRELPSNEIGEVMVNSPYNMDGYYKNDEKTRETLVNGWLMTGDLGYKDQNGFLYLLDRRKDMIISGGMNIYSSEVEKVIQQHPSVSQVAVIGIPHNDWGEAVMAVIVTGETDKCNKEEIFNMCKKELSSYKVPKYIEFVSDLPLTPYGKIDKKKLRQTYSR